MDSILNVFKLDQTLSMDAPMVNGPFNSSEPIHVAQETILVYAAKTGDESAFVELRRRCLPMVSRKIYRILQNTADTEDALQECMFKAYMHLDQFDGRSAFSTWVTRIGVNTALMTLRKQRKHRADSSDGWSTETNGWSSLDIEDKTISQEEAFAEAELRLRLREAVERLPEHLRLVFELRQNKDASLKEISDSLQLSMVTVKSRLFRGRRALRRLLHRQCE
jgi:RNA polymerase sigma-70 factor (ECF subfamily)